MVGRVAALSLSLLLIAGVLLWGMGLQPTTAQDAEPTESDAWPTIGEFQVTGTFQAAGTIASAGTVAAAGTVAPVPASIRVLAPAADDERLVLAADVGVELILDNSGSMLQPIAGTPRIDVAKAVLTELVTDTLPAEIPLALRVFGDEPESCKTELAIPLSRLDPETALAQIALIESVDGVKTPIGAALKRVAGDLTEVDGPKLVILVSDGEETCLGNPRDAIQELVAQGIDVRVNIVGFALDDDALKAEFTEWARLGGGAYFDASGSEGLRDAIASALQPPFEIRDAGGDLAGVGVVGGEPVRVPPGTYTVTIRSQPSQTFEGVEVGDGEALELTPD